MRFDLKRPCADCPFRQVGGVELSPGRFEEIVGDLADDSVVFYCHKTIDYGQVDEDSGKAEYSGEEQVCMGAMAYMRRAGHGLPVAARAAIMTGILSLDDIEASAQDVRIPTSDDDQ